MRTLRDREMAERWRLAGRYMQGDSFGCLFAILLVDRGVLPHFLLAPLFFALLLTATLGVVAAGARYHYRLKRM